jgi:hypothetical protein
MCIGLQVKYRFSYPILTKIEFSGQVFEKYKNVKFHVNPSSGSRVPCGQTDRHEEANSRFSQFCELTTNGEISREYSTHSINDKC